MRISFKVYKKEFDLLNCGSLTGKLCLASQEHMRALELFGSVMEHHHAHPSMDVETLVFSAAIAIQTCYRRTSTDSEHNQFAPACNYIVAAQEYLDHHHEGMFSQQIDWLQRM
jgi:hypothetical protein